MAKPDNIHRHKLFNGRTNAQELWRQTVLAGKLCGKCRTMKAIGTINLFCPADDFQRLYQRIAVKYATECGGRIPYVQFTAPGGEPRNFVALPVVYFCGQCRSEMEKWAARAHSGIVGEVRTGPDADKVIGQVPGGPRPH